MSSAGNSSKDLEAKRDFYETISHVRAGGPIGGLSTFNSHYGYLEGILR